MEVVTEGVQMENMAKWLLAVEFVIGWREVTFTSIHRVVPTERGLKRLEKALATLESNRDALVDYAKERSGKLTNEQMTCLRSAYRQTDEMVKVASAKRDWLKNHLAGQVLGE